MENLVTLILYIIYVYLLVGVFLYYPLIKKGILTFDESMHKTPLFFKILIFPGVVALWLLLVLKWKYANNILPKIHKK